MNQCNADESDRSSLQSFNEHNVFKTLSAMDKKQIFGHH